VLCHILWKTILKKDTSSSVWKREKECTGEEILAQDDTQTLSIDSDHSASRSPSIGSPDLGTVIKKKKIL
jgi:hypothetical protein